MAKRSIEGLQHLVETMQTNRITKVEKPEEKARFKPIVESICRRSKRLHEAVESSPNKELVIYRFPISRINTLERKNKNGRVYGIELWRKVVNEQRDIWQYTTGLANHPADDEEPDWRNQAIVWIDADIDEGDGIVYGYGIFVGQNGQLAQDVLDAHGKVGFSTAGFGQCDSQGVVNPDNYVIERLADLVLDPSQGVFGTSDDVVDYDGNADSGQLYDDNDFYESTKRDNKMKDKLYEDDNADYTKVKDAIAKAAVNGDPDLSSDDGEKAAAALKKYFDGMDFSTPTVADAADKIANDYNEARKSENLSDLEMTGEKIKNAGGSGEEKSDENKSEENKSDEEKSDENTEQSSEDNSDQSSGEKSDTEQTSESTINKGKKRIMENETINNEALSVVNGMIADAAREHFFDQKASTLDKMHNPKEIKAFTEETLKYLNASISKSSTPHLDELKEKFSKAYETASSDLDKIVESGTALFDKNIDDVNSLVEKAENFDKSEDSIKALHEQVATLKERAQNALLERDSYKNSYFAASNTIKNLKKALAETNQKAIGIKKRAAFANSKIDEASNNIESLKSKLREAKIEIARLNKKNARLTSDNKSLNEEIAYLNKKFMKSVKENQQVTAKYDSLSRAHSAMVESNRRFDDEAVHGKLDAQKQRLNESKAFKQDTNLIWEDAYASYGDAILPMKESILNAKTKNEAEFQIIKFLGGMVK